MSDTLTGSLDDSGCRIEATDNDDAWIEAEYRDGWVARKLMNADGGEAYASMTHPYYQQCAHCREWQTTERWGAKSRYCPRCEMWYEITLPRIIAWLFDGEDISAQEASI